MKKLVLYIFMLVSVSLAADLNFAKELYEDELYEEAISEFRKIIDTKPTSDEAQTALFFIGDSFIQLEQYSQAETIFNRFIEAYPSYKKRDEVLYNLASSQYEQQKYEKALQNYERLIHEFPLSSHTKNSLVKNLQCYYFIGKYNQLILKSKEYEKNYPETKKVSDFLFWRAKAYLANNMQKEAKNTLSLIEENYPNSNARWQALGLRIVILEQEEGKDAAIESLSEALKQNIPRFYEEELRYKLVKLYLQQENYNLALHELKALIEKFNMSAKMPEYIADFTYTQLKLKKYADIIAEYQGNLKYFKNSKLQPQYGYYVGKAYYQMSNYQQAQELVSKYKALAKPKLKTDLSYLEAVIWEETNKLTNAIELYQQLLRQNAEKSQDILMRLGDIYFNNFQDYKTAIKYYDLLFTNYSNSKFRFEAAYKMALCYENQNQLEDAISELQNINLNEIEDDSLKQKVKFRLDYLLKYKYKDYETALGKLLTTFCQYLQEDDKENTSTQLVKILLEDLKEYETGLALLEEIQSPYSSYLKSKLYLQLANREKMEGNRAQAEEYISIVETLQNDFIDNEQWGSEIEVKKKLYRNDTLDEKLITNMEVFVSRYPLAEASNEFILIIADYYQDNEDYEKAAGYFEQLEKTNNIPDSKFFDVKITLAEYHYSKDNDAEALKNYRLAEPAISLQKPEVLFHYAVVLHQQGFEENAVQKFEFLLKNASVFSGFKSAVNYFCNILREAGEYEKVVNYMQLVPEKQQDDDYFMQLTQDLLKLDKKQEAKEALMRIIEKDYEALSLLAKLQYETKDWEIAKYSLKKLIEEKPSDLENYLLLAQIHFAQENYAEAQPLYEKVFDKLGNDFDEFSEIDILVTQYAISLYHRENRPKAEKVIKQFQKYISEAQKNKIELHEGIYYIKLNPSKAVKVLSNLLDKDNLQPKMMIETYFWRGVAYMEDKQLKEAEEDFTTVANSVDKKLSSKAHLKLGTIKFSQENFQKALSHYYYVIQNDTDGDLAFDAAKNFAYVCKTIEEWQKAVEAYQIILERWGDAELEAQTIFDIAFCHFRDKKYEKAIQMFQQSMQILEDGELKAEAQYWLAESYFGMENYEKAVTEFLKVSYNYNDYLQWAALSELRAGQVYLEAGSIEKAKRLFNRIIDKYSASSDWGREAVKILKELQ